jgi:hypothetical protein
MGNKEERELINAIHKKRKLEPKIEAEFQLFQRMLPAIREAINANGGADAILKKSESIAAMTLIEATQSEKDEVRLKAASEILNRTIGRPVERSVNIYGDISKMNERDIDNQIMQLIDRTGAKNLIETTLGVKVRKKKRLQSRKPRKNEALVIEGSLTEAHPSAEARVTPEPSDESAS